MTARDGSSADDVAVRAGNDRRTMRKNSSSTHRWSAPGESAGSCACGASARAATSIIENHLLSTSPDN
jgi:hypothetical protein